MKKIARTLSLSFIIMLAVTVLFSCKKENKSGTHKVKFKAETSSDAKLSSVVYTNETGNTTNSSVNSSSFSSSELTIPSSIPVITFGASGTGANAGSTLKVQIWVDGNLVKESIGTGTALSATTTYSF